MNKPTDEARLAEHIYYLVQKSRNVERHALSDHWGLISSLASILAKCFVLTESKLVKPQLKMTPVVNPVGEPDDPTIP